MTHVEPAVLRTLMWCQLGQISPLFGWLNGKIYNSNHKFLSLSQWLCLSPLLFYQIQTSHFTSQSANLFWLGRGFCTLIFFWNRDPMTLSMESNSGQIWRKEIHGFYSESMVCLVKHSLEALGQQVETCFARMRVRFWLEKKSWEVLPLR